MSGSEFWGERVRTYVSWTQGKGGRKWGNWIMGYLSITHVFNLEFSSLSY